MKKVPYCMISMDIHNKIYLPFSATISGPPESPLHESFRLLLSPAQMWKLNEHYVRC